MEMIACVILAVSLSVYRIWEISLCKKHRSCSHEDW